MSNQVLDLNQARINQIKRQNDANQSVSLGAKGFVMLHRKIKKTSFYKDSEAVHLFIHLLMDATYKTSLITMNGKEILLNRGQLITGRKSLSQETGITEPRVQYLLSKLQKHGVIKINPSKQYSVITVVNYEEYQWADNNQKAVDFVTTDSQQIHNAKSVTASDSTEVVTTDSQQIHTINNINNISNTKVLDRSFSNDSQQQPESSKSDEPKKPQLRCEDVLKIFNEVLPEISARGLSEKRRQQIRLFWQKARKVKNDLENTPGAPFTLDDWKSYLEYIAKRCRWMLTEGYNHSTGNKWRKKSISYILSENLYLEVREGLHDDK